MAKASKQQLDFTNVKDIQFNPKHYPEGDYRGKVTKVQDAKSKKDKAKMWLFTIEVKNGIYPYYCKLEENQLWKIRNLFVAAGINVPKKRVAVDPNKVVGRSIGVNLEDDEYEGKMKSIISATFPSSELEEEDEDPDEEEEDDEEDDEDDEEEEDDDEEEDDEDSEDDDDDDDEEEEPEPPKKKSKKSKGESQGKKKSKKSKAKKVDDVDDDELEELEIEDI